MEVLEHPTITVSPLLRYINGTGLVESEGCSSDGALPKYMKNQLDNRIVLNTNMHVSM